MEGCFENTCMKITAINDFDISKFLDGKLFVIIKKKKRFVDCKPKEKGAFMRRWRKGV